MACYVPFNSRNLDISFFVFKPTIVLIDDLVDSLKQFSLCTESLGCVHSSIFRSIHGNMIIWYGAWMKRSNEKRQKLDASLLSMLKGVASMAILTDHSFFEAYCGESKNGSPAAKFFNGDIISMSSINFSAENFNKDSVSYGCLALFRDHKDSVSYGCLALFRDRFYKMDGAKAGIHFRSQSLPRMVGLYVWKSLQSCYTYIITSDYRKTVLPYLDGFGNVDIKYDIFRVVYISGENAMDIQHSLLANGTENEGYPIVQEFNKG